MDVRSYSDLNPLIEILVHISGSSGAKDDVRYRAQAAAYLDFEPYHSNALLSTGEQAAGDTTIDRQEAPLGTASNTVARGSAEREDVQFWNTFLEARAKNRGSDAQGTAIQCDHAAPLPKIPALSAAETVDQASHAIVTLQLPARIPSGTKEPLSNQDDPFGKNCTGKTPSVAVPDIQPTVYIQMDPPTAKCTIPPCLPPAAKRQRIRSPSRPPHNGPMETSESGTEHPCSHMQSLLNCGACMSGPHQHISQCNNCVHNLCSTCHTTFQQGQEDQTAVTTPIKQSLTTDKIPLGCPGSALTFSPRKGHSENVPLFPRYACHHWYNHIVAGPGLSLLFCTTCSNAVLGAFKCKNCRSTLCQQCHNRYTQPRVQSSAPKPRLLAPKQPAPCASSPPPPPQLPTAHSPPPTPVFAPDPPPDPPLRLQINRQQQYSPLSKPKPSRKGKSRIPPTQPSPPLVQLRNLLPAGPPPLQSSSYPPLPSPSPSPPATEIHPPPPQTSSPSSRPPPLITASFNLLASKMPLQKYFAPVFVGRSLRPMERGYWRIHITAWDINIKERFWRFLEEFVGDGRAGWGVWVSRTVEMGDGMVAEKGSATVPGVGEPRDHNMEVVRVYCWGEVVGYIWLVMVIASDRRAKGSGCCWVDAGEQVIIRMA